MPKKPIAKKPETEKPVNTWQSLLAKAQEDRKPSSGTKPGNRPKDSRQVTHNLRRRMGR